MRKKLHAQFLRLTTAVVSSTLLVIGLGNTDVMWTPIPFLAGILLFFFTWFVLRTADQTAEDYRSQESVGDLFVSLVIPFYNEAPMLLRRGLDSIGHQSRPPDRVWIIDDGSSLKECTQIAEEWASEQQQKQAIDARVIIQRHNLGKREALARAFREDEDADIFFTVDSDTILDPHAIDEGVKPFGDSKIYAVAGTLSGHNRNQNLLTRIVDMEFACGFLVYRATMSRLGAVLVTCGSLAAYRAEICREHVDDLLNEHFLGAPVLNGDDRKLTQFALRRGQVVMQEKCTGKVALPQSLGHLLRQRIRWSTSFYRGTIYMLKTTRLTSMSFWLTLFYAGAFSAQVMIILGIVFFGAAIGWMNLALVIAALFIPVTLLGHWRYWNSALVDKSKVGPVEYYSLSVLATLLSLVVLMPLRFFALLYVRSKDWRTRQEVETVTLAEGE